MTEDQQKPKAFPLERILTVSADDYCKSQETGLGDYRLQGVHLEISDNELRQIRDPRDSKHSETVITRFCEVVPAHAEAVVEYRIMTCRAESRNGTKYMYHQAHGTALIRKE